MARAIPLTPRESQIRRLMQFMLIRDVEDEETGVVLDAEDEEDRFFADFATYYAIQHTRYSVGRHRAPKAGNFHLLWQYARDPVHHSRFAHLVRVTPPTFLRILSEIEANPIFRNNAYAPQASVEFQLAVALHRLGRFGNGVSMDDEAFLAGIGHGTVALYTRRVIVALLAIHGTYVRILTNEERTQERERVLDRVGCPELAPGIYQYDGTTIPLWQKPGLNGDAYWSRHGAYELNVQIGCTGSNMRIVDYSMGCTGSAHDALAFRSTAAYLYPDYIFKDDDFAWTDSAYPASYRMIPIHKAPANLDPRVRLFDAMVSRLRVGSEHCNGMLKGKWQSLRGLRISINRRRDYVFAMSWISACIVLHNICADVGDNGWERLDGEQHPREEEIEGRLEEEPAAGGERRRHLVNTYYESRVGLN